VTEPKRPQQKSWPEYLLEALGLGLIIGCLTLATVELVGSPSVGKGLLWGLVGFMLGSGFRLAAGRTPGSPQ
jgi:hypothetical protein